MNKQGFFLRHSESGIMVYVFCGLYIFWWQKYE